MKKLCAGMFILLLFVTGMITGCIMQPQQIRPNAPERKSGEFIIAGSGSNIVVTKKLVEAFRKDRRLTIEIPDSIGSGGGIKGVESGSIDLAITSRPLNDAEKASGLKEIPYARSGLIVVAGSDVPDDNVSYNDLVMIYQGRKNTWSNGAPIIVFVMYEKDSTNEVLMREVPGFKEVLIDSLRNNRWQVFYNQQAQEQALMKTPHSIGFINMSGTLETKMKPIKVNGVIPSRENVLNGSYKLYKTLNYVYREPLDQAILSFIDFTFSEQGREILLDSECIPLSK